MGNDQTNAALIPAATSVVNAGINAFAASNLNKKTQKFSREMYGKQREDAMADYYMQNEYNSPKSQMARLKEAGLNPHLVYGNGNAIASGATVRSSTAPAWNPKTPDIDLGGVGASMFNYISAQKSRAEIDNLKEQNTVLAKEGALKDAQKLNTEASTVESMQRTSTSKFQLEQLERLKDINLQAAQANLQKTEADTKFTLNQDERAAAQNSASLAEAYTRIQKMKSETVNSNLLAKLQQLDIDLKKMGVQPSDALWQRMLARAIGSTNSSLPWNQFSRYEKPTQAQQSVSGVLKQSFNYKPKKR